MKKDVALKIENLKFGYEKNENLFENFNLEVEKGKFTTLLGESGCGKTTLLRLISGFLEAKDGNIFINGINQNKIDANKRKIGIVFQDYALFPHLTVEENICYGLKLQKLTKNEIEQKVKNIAEVLSLENLLKRYPHELSGGQQQRVALGRVLVLNPEILLMDEPLSSLDASLREKLREELKEIQKKYKITTIYVTHDQIEALSLSDEIVLLKNGKILQQDSPNELYFKPRDKYTSDFIGKANFIKIEQNEFVVRPEWFTLAEKGENDEFDIFGKVTSSSFLGERTRFIIEVDKKSKYFSENENFVVADLSTLKTMSFKEGNPIFLKINHKWKIC